MRTKGSAKELEVKRRIACNLLNQGKSRAEVARLVGSSWQSVNRWKKAFDWGGMEAIAAKTHPGRPPRLKRSQQNQVVKILERGALKAGFPTDLWNGHRVATIIRKKFGVAYHEHYIPELLVKWGWSLQKPEYRAREQVPEAVERWRKEEWERIKKGIQK